MTTPRYTREQITQLYDAKEWNTLWKVVIEPMVKHTVKRCMQEGLDPFYVRDDLMQEAYLAAWAALPRWNAFEGALSTWISEKVRSAVLDTNRRESSGMVGGRDANAFVTSMHGTEPDEDSSNDNEQASSIIPEASMVYKDLPEGFGDPAEDGEEERMLALVPEKDRDMVRRLCGVGVPEETQEEYAQTEGVTQTAIAKRLVRLQAKLNVMFSRKPANQAMWELHNSGEGSERSDNRAA